MKFKIQDFSDDFFFVVNEKLVFLKLRRKFTVGTTTETLRKYSFILSETRHQDKRMFFAYICSFRLFSIIELRESTSYTQHTNAIYSEHYDNTRGGENENKFI